MIGGLKISKWHSNETKETVYTITGQCPGCNTENSLIIMKQKDTQLPSGVVSNLRLGCVRCNFKWSGVYRL